MNPFPNESNRRALALQYNRQSGLPANTPVTDEMLVNLTTLYAWGNSGITDVSALVNLTTLDAGGNSGITDVSALVNLTTLYAWGNSGITDVSKQIIRDRAERARRASE